MQRFKTRPQFQAALAGNVIAKTSHFALHRAETTPSAIDAKPLLFPSRDVWVGAMTPKRWAKRAVTRNAIKRQIYTVSASLTSQFPTAAFLVRLRREFSRNDDVSASSEALKEAVRTQLLVLLHAAIAHK